MNIKSYFRASIAALLTAGMLVGGMAAGAGVASACAPDGNTSHELASTLPQVRPGAVGKYVVGLQLALRNNGYSLTGTGYYGTDTLTAVRDFQRHNGINDSGIVGSKTWHALVGRMSYDVTHSHGDLPTFGVRPGERDSEKVQELANYVMRLYPYADWQNWTGDGYDQLLVTLVQRFQRSVGIKASGIVGPKTWQAMDEVVSISGGWGC